MATRRIRRAAPRILRPIAAPVDPEIVRPATRAETLPIGMVAIVVGFVALAISAVHGTMLLYGDAVAHLGIARRIIDNNAPGLFQWGGVWLPLPHLLMLPFVWKPEWWQNGMAGAWPSLACYIVGTMGMYRLARRLLPVSWALVPTAFFGLNANLLYLSTTAMTEPLFLALLVWIVLVTLELVESLDERRIARGARLLVLLGVLLLAAVMTRYDGWVLAVAVWTVVAVRVLRNGALRASLMPAFAFFTFLTLAGPVAWLSFNHVYGHDWLDFLRGPYSAVAIERRTTPPGAGHHWGWHNPLIALVLYMRTAQLDAAWWEAGWLIAAAAIAGTWQFARARHGRAAGLLWLPLPFYVYSIAYGSVPIFIPPLPPYSFYNSRYGIEMLPAFALFGTLGILAAVRHFARLHMKPLVLRLVPPIALLLIAINTVLMLHATPLVLKEAQVNSVGRLALDGALARQLMTFESGAPILMENSDHVGALQQAAIPLKQTYGPSDFYRWRDGLRDPAATAAYVVAIDGDAVAAAVQAHPEGLTELSIVCTSGEPCVRVYRSNRYVPPGSAR